MGYDELLSHERYNLKLYACDIHIYVHMTVNTSYTISYCALNESDDYFAIVFQHDAKNSKWWKEDNTIENPNL